MGLKSLKIAVVLGWVGIAGCAPEGAPRFDGSSPAAAEESMGRLMAPLPPEEQLRLEVALEEIGAPYFDLAADPSKLGDAWERRLDELVAAFWASLDGKTAVQVIRMAGPAVTRRIELERSELAALSKKQASALAARPELEKLEAVRAELDLGQPGSRAPPQLGLVVRNNTQWVIHDALFHVVLATPGRTMAWMEQEIWRHFSGGIEPGEQAGLRAPLNVDWRFTRADDAAELTVVTRDIRGAGEDAAWFFTHSRF